MTAPETKGPSEGSVKIATNLAEQICEHYTGASDDGTCEHTVGWIASALDAMRERTVRECADIANEWAKSKSCEYHDHSPCCHVRTGVAIRERILAFRPGQESAPPEEFTDRE